MARGTGFVHRLAAAIAHIFYRVNAVGAVPAGPLILLPNHPNALLDPALVMATAGRPIRFLAKSTLFAGPFAPLLKAANTIPVYRKQDGAVVGRNQETFADVDAALARGEAVCIFPEGISHSSGKLEPLRTGAARMALSAVAGGTDLQMVPVGINLERKTVFRSRATVAYGPAFRVPAGAPTPSLERVKALTSEMADRIRALLVEADPRSDAELVERVDRLYRSERPQPQGAHATLVRRKAIAEAMHRMRAERPEWYASALIQLRRHDDRLRRFGLRDGALDWQLTPAAAWAFIAREVPAALLLVPVAVTAGVTFAIPYGLTAAAGRVSTDMDVTATAKVVGGTVIYAAWIGLLTLVSWWVAGPTGLLVSVGLPVLAIAGLFAIERETAAWLTARSWLALRGAHPTTRVSLKRRRAELAEVVDAVNDWIQAP
ncbi:MAG: 1-acyl-sn-glycerol-3-phosphate acyltransferase [Acidobacteria bacterium]|nr:1-acyl-sn-glycerol-3-phosphate acyltransferase [Acidobacteriota bacterium]